MKSALTQPENGYLMGSKSETIEAGDRRARTSPAEPRADAGAALAATANQYHSEVASCGVAREAIVPANFRVNQLVYLRTLA